MCLGKPHVSFPSELAVRRIGCFVWSAESEGKLSAARSPVLLNVKSSCYFTVSNNISFILYVIYSPFTRTAAVRFVLYKCRLRLFYIFFNRLTTKL